MQPEPHDFCNKVACSLSHIVSDMLRKSHKGVQICPDGIFSFTPAGIFYSISPGSFIYSCRKNHLLPPGFFICFAGIIYIVHAYILMWINL